MTEEEYDLNQSLIQGEYGRNQSRLFYQSLNDLDKESCLGIESEFFKDNCINGIDLIEEALKQNDIELCQDSSYDVDGEVIFICVRKLMRGQFNE